LTCWLSSLLFVCSFSGLARSVSGVIAQTSKAAAGIALKRKRCLLLDLLIGLLLARTRSHVVRYNQSMLCRLRSQHRLRACAHMLSGATVSRWTCWLSLLPQQSKWVGSSCGWCDRTDYRGSRRNSTQAQEVPGVNLSVAVSPAGAHAVTCCQVCWKCRSLYLLALFAAFATWRACTQMLSGTAD
jgi:hypothetical protein